MLNVTCHVPPQVTFNPIPLVDSTPYVCDLIIGQHIRIGVCSHSSFR
jgi:hypothetical protein